MQCLQLPLWITGWPSPILKFLQNPYVPSMYQYAPPLISGISSLLSILKRDFPTIWLSSIQRSGNNQSIDDKMSSIGKWEILFGESRIWYFWICTHLKRHNICGNQESKNIGTGIPEFIVWIRVCFKFIEETLNSLLFNNRSKCRGEKTNIISSIFDFATLVEPRAHRVLSWHATWHLPKRLKVLIHSTTMYASKTHKNAAKAYVIVFVVNIHWVSWNHNLKSKDVTC